MKKLLENLKVKKMGQLLMFCAALLTLSSCGHRPDPAINIAPTLFAPTPTPPAPQGEYTQKDVAQYILKYKKSLAVCNLDKATIEQILTVNP